MTYEIVKSGSNEYAVDWPTVERLLRSYWTSTKQLECAKLVNTSESKFYNPFSWPLPEMQQLDVAWDDVRQKAQASTRMDMNRFHALAPYNMRGIAYEMLMKVRQTKSNKDAFVRRMAAVQEANARAFEKSDSQYEGLISAAKFLRNSSATVLVTGSAVVAVPAGVGLAGGIAFLGVGATLTGVGEFQDTDKVGSAIFKGLGTFAFGLFKLPGVNMTKSGEYALILVKGVYDSSTSLVSGDSLAEATKKGALKITGEVGAKALGDTEIAKKVLGKISLPIKLSKASTSAENELASGKFVSGLAKKTLSNATSGTLLPSAATAILGRGSISSSTPGNLAQPGSMDRRGILYDAILNDEFLLYLTIVHMQNGVGRGW